MLHSTHMYSDEHYMKIALELAEKGRGSVSPNPMVGAVIVHDGKIISSGYHAQFGGPHAEVNAILSVSKENERFLQDSTIFVTLEPCAHFGKTPPCADLLIEKKFKRVVVGSFDPNPKVSGAGIAKIKNAGISVTENTLQKECDELNKYFMTYHKLHRPFVVLKWAESSDGFMAPSTPSKFWLSCDESKKIVHEMRSEVSAILVGTKTVEIDDPELTTRLVPGKNPTRLIIDKHLKLPLSKKVFAENSIVYIYNGIKSEVKNNLHFVKIDFGDNILPQILEHLYSLNIISVLIEGGAFTLSYFIKADLWDEILLIHTQKSLDTGIPSPKFEGTLVSETSVASDIHKKYISI